MIKLICGDIYYYDGNISKNTIVILEGYIIFRNKIYRNYYNITTTDYNGEYYFVVKNRSSFYRIRLLEGGISHSDNVIIGG